MTILKPSFTQKLKREALLEYPDAWVAPPEMFAEWMSQSIAQIDQCRAFLEECASLPEEP